MRLQHGAVHDEMGGRRRRSLQNRVATGVGRGAKAVRAREGHGNNDTRLVGVHLRQNTKR